MTDLDLQNVGSLWADVDEDLDEDDRAAATRRRAELNRQIPRVVDRRRLV